MQVLKELSNGLAVCQDPLRNEYARMSNNERNVLGSKALSLENSDCTPMIDAMQSDGSDGTLGVFGDRSVKDGRDSHTFRI